MSFQPFEATERTRRWRELWVLYLTMTLGTLLVDQIARFWSVFSSMSVLIVALGFIFLPTEFLIRRGESLIDFGIGGSKFYPQETLSTRAIRCTKQASFIALLVFPLFIGGQHLWQQLQGQQSSLSTRAFQRWDEVIQGFSQVPIKPGEVNLSARLDRVKLTWKLKPKESQLQAEIKLDLPGKVIAKSTGVKVIPPVNQNQAWRIIGSKQGYVLLKTPSMSLNFKGLIDQKPLAEPRLFLGEYHQTSTNHEFKRDFSWLWSIFFIQLFLVGLPEEIFYRGYLQTRLDSLIGQDQKVFGIDFNWSSTFVCSALFAVAHLMTIPHPSRLAVFFPSLLFGWMRRAYNDTLSPAIFHAACNVLAQILWGIYALH